MSRAARNTRFFWFMIAVFLLVAYTSVMFVSTVDSCGRNGSKRWQWAPPRWVCTVPSYAR